MRTSSGISRSNPNTLNLDTSVELAKRSALCLAKSSVIMMMIMIILNDRSGGDNTYDLKNGTNEHDEGQGDHDSRVSKRVSDHRNTLKTCYP